MKLLKIENGVGKFYSFERNAYVEITLISGETLLKLVDYVIENDDFEFDQYNKDEIKNTVQDIVYKDIFEKLNQLKDQKKSIVDEIENKYADASNKYLS